MQESREKASVGEDRGPGDLRVKHIVHEHIVDALLVLRLVKALGDIDVRAPLFGEESLPSRANTGDVQDLHSCNLQ